jgi:hypothetical protein
VNFTVSALGSLTVKTDWPAVVLTWADGDPFTKAVAEFDDSVTGIPDMGESVVSSRLKVTVDVPLPKTTVGEALMDSPPFWYDTVAVPMAHNPVAVLYDPGAVQSAADEG